jgi:hypothetical protein
VASILADTHKYLTTIKDSLSRTARSGGHTMFALDQMDWRPLGEKLARHLVTMAKDGAAEGLGQVHHTKIRRDRGPTKNELLELLHLADEEAIEWAEERAAELVGLHRNPDGSWDVSDQPGMSISETTRTGVRELVTDAMTDGWSNDRLADAIEGAYEFSDTRCETIARFETAQADLEGNRAGWRNSGVVRGRRWDIGTDNIEVCDDCEQMDGEEVEGDDEFEGGNAPRHPRCRCNETPIMVDEEKEDE